MTIETCSSKKVLTLYVGEGCHLCDQARHLLQPVIAELSWTLEEISIVGDETLVATYGLRIPVVKTPAGEEKGWPFTVGQIKRLLT